MKYAEDLAKDYDFQSETEYFDYIINSLVNGNRQQVKRLFNQMKKCDKETFLINHIDVNIGYHKSVLNMCIGELCK
jgi:ribosomal protein S24E